MLKIHSGIFDKERREIFQVLFQFRQYGYLAGGTALALQMAHRESYDFDVFVEKPISTTLKAKVREVFGAVDYYVNTADQISFRTQQNINITFLWYYFAPLFPLVTTTSLPLAALKDIAADKAYTIGRRAVWRDYVDYFFLLQQQWVTLAEIIDLAKKKFEGEFNEALFLQQLSYFRDVAIAPIAFLHGSFTVSEIQSFLQQEVESYTRSLV